MKSHKEPADAQAPSAQLAENASAEGAKVAQAQHAKIVMIANTATLAKDEKEAQPEEEAQPAKEPATVAHCSAEETVEVTDAELQSRQAANAEPAKAEAEPIASASPAGPAMVNAAEVEKLVNEAYLRGRNEAIECRMIADTSLFGNPATLDTTGMRADFSSLFETRKSVWGNTL